MALRWDPEVRRWRESGKLLSFKQQASVRDELADLYAKFIREETNLYLSGKLEYDAWVANVENYVLQATGSGYAFGRGGVAHMSDGDYDRLARTLDRQVELFRRFVGEVKTGSLTAPQIQARAESYAGSVIYAHEQAANQAAIGDDPNANWELPFYPGADTQCLNNCRCYWEIDEDAYGWTCTYHVVSDAQTCGDCERRGGQHGPGSPLTFPKADAPVRINELAVV